MCVHRTGWALIIAGGFPWWIGGAIEVALRNDDTEEGLTRALLSTASSAVIGAAVVAFSMFAVVMRY
eukprot:SAG31_NODE_16672_length_700_cov_1.272879_1_plen_67_part_00